MSGVRKTSLVMCDRVAQELDAGACVLVVTPTTCARTQAVDSLLAHGLQHRMRVVGCQKLGVAEEALVLEALVLEGMLPWITAIEKADQTLHQELEALGRGDAHNVHGAHQQFVVHREQAEEALGEVQAAVLAARQVCISTVGTLLAADGPQTHRVPRSISLLCIDEAGILTTAELALLLCQLGTHLAANCKVLLLGDPCQDCGQRLRKAWPEVERFLNVDVGLNLLQYLFRQLRAQPPDEIRRCVRFLNAELPSARLYAPSSKGRVKTLGFRVHALLFWVRRVLTEPLAPVRHGPETRKAE